MSDGTWGLPGVTHWDGCGEIGTPEHEGCFISVEHQSAPPPERAILTDLITELRDVHSAFEVCNECSDWGDDCGDHDRMTACRACCTEGDGWHTMHCADTHPGTGSRLTDHCPTVASLDRAEYRLREVSDE